MKYLWDTNTVIYYLQNQLSKEAERFIEEILQEAVPAISAITEIELLSWKHATEVDLLMLRSFVNDALVYEIEHNVKYQAVDVRRKNSIKLPDAVIAATALVHNLTLISRNSKDFSKIDGLAFVNPFE